MPTPTSLRVHLTLLCSLGLAACPSSPDPVAAVDDDDTVEDDSTPLPEEFPRLGSVATTHLAVGQFSPQLLLGFTSRQLSSDVDFDGDGVRDLVVAGSSSKMVLGLTAATLASGGERHLGTVASFIVETRSNVEQIAWLDPSSSDPMLAISEPWSEGGGTLHLIPASSLQGAVQATDHPLIRGDEEECNEFGVGLQAIDDLLLVSKRSGRCSLGDTHHAGLLVYGPETWTQLPPETSWQAADAWAESRFEDAVVADGSLWLSHRNSSTLFRTTWEPDAVGEFPAPPTPNRSFQGPEEGAIGESLQAVELDGRPGLEIVVGDPVGSSTDLPAGLDQQGRAYIIPGDVAQEPFATGPGLVPLDEVAWSLTSSDRAGRFHGRSVASIDIDCDGRLDLVTSARSEPAVRIWLADTLDALVANPPPASTSSFDLAYSLRARGDERYGVTVHNLHDVDQDGCDDLLVASTGDLDEMWVLRGAPREQGRE